jgi:hypothetical protein
MAAKRSRHSRHTKSFATKADIAKIYRVFEERRIWLEGLERTCNTQFQRIAQMQAELDEIRRELTNARSTTR